MKREKPEYPEKNQEQTQPTYDAECSHLCAILLCRTATNIKGCCSPIRWDWFDIVTGLALFYSRSKWPKN